MLTTSQDWFHLFERETAESVTRTLSNILRTRRWFGGKARRIEAVRIVESIAIPSGSTTTMLLLIRVEYGGGDVETYTLPVTAAFGDEAERIRQECPEAVYVPCVVQGNGREQTGLLYDALWNRDAALAFLEAISRESQFKGTAGCLIASRTNAFADLVAAGTVPEPAVMKAEQSNTSVAYNRRVILKLYRRLEQGMNPDLELGRVLTHMQFQYSPPIAGALEYRRDTGEPITLALLQKFVCNDGDAWQQSLDAVNRFVARIIGASLRDEALPRSGLSPLELARQEYSPVARHLIGPDLESAERLGRRTAELHLALSQVVEDPAFAAEPLTREYRQARYDSMVRRTVESLGLLEERIGVLSTVGQAKARRLFELKPALERTFQAFRDLESPIPRFRCHGDYHLGQVLCTGDDFMIIDFEGEPARSLTERRMKQPAMLDVAGMVRSFHYAPFAFLEGKRTDLTMTLEERPRCSARGAQFWSDWAGAAFLKGYLGIATGARFWPRDDRDAHLLFEAFLLEKATYELGYELNNRPEWVEIPLGSLVETLEIKG
jgi:trehalose synthase-fused probable maltokinase